MKNGYWDILFFVGQTIEKYKQKLEEFSSFDLFSTRLFFLSPNETSNYDLRNYENNLILIHLNFSTCQIPVFTAINLFLFFLLLVARSIFNSIIHIRRIELITII